MSDVANLKIDDELLDRLNERDGNAVVIRFFEDRSLTAHSNYPIRKTTVDDRKKIVADLQDH